jgi:hypothetical protein
MDKHHIIKGYKGVIDLDLSLVLKSYIKMAIAQHYKDIEEYKKYQRTLKPEHRYENTIERINMNIEKKIRIKNEKLRNEQNRRYELCRKITDNIM